MHAPRSNASSHPRTFRRSAFTLIEMLVVLVILTVVIAIVVPTIAAFRNTARKAVTTDIMASLSTAVGQFRLSQNRLPGYFSAAEIGAAANDDSINLTSMENLMLDLAGGITQDAESPPALGALCDLVGGPAVISVGPSPTNKVRVKIGRIGAADGGSAGEIVRGYYKPDPKYFQRQCQPKRRAGATPANHWAMPVLVDAWGSPILAWVQDSVPQTFPLLSETSAAKAKFYAQSNRAFTQATGLGKLGRDQNNDSLYGVALSGANWWGSVAGVVGNPAFAGEARSPIVFQSAGSDGVYLGREERGAKSQTVSGVLPRPIGRDYFAEGDFNDVIGKAD